MTKRASLSLGTPASTNFNDVTASQAAKPVNEKNHVNSTSKNNKKCSLKLTSFNCQQHSR